MANMANMLFILYIINACHQIKHLVIEDGPNGSYHENTDYSTISHIRIIEYKMAKRKKLVRIAAAFLLFGSS